MLRLVGYIRVSKDRLEQKTSLENQKQQILQYAKANNYEVVDFYVDVESGTSTKRKELKRLINDAEKKKFDLLVSKDISRLARNVEYSFKIKRLMEAESIHIITLDGALNTIEGNTRMFGFLSCFSEEEALSTSVKLKSMLKTRAKNGLFNGSIAPYGYYCEKGKLYIRNDDSPIVINRIFNEYLSGKGIDTIAKGLFNDNVPTSSQLANKANSSNIWYGKSIKKILTNQAYIGNLEQLKESSISIVNKKRKSNIDGDSVLVENTHEPIIDKTVFFRVQELLTSKKRERGHQSIHIFTNVLRCADCKKGMHFKKNRKGYICGTSVKLGKNVCSDHKILESDLSSIILEDLNKYIKPSNSSSKINTLKSEHKKKVSAFETKIKSHTSKISLLEKRRLSTFDFLVDGTISKAEYEYHTSKYIEEIKMLSLQVEAFKSQLEILNCPSTLEKIAKAKFTHNKIKELTLDIVNMFIEKIEISEDGSPTIYYTF